MANKRPRLVTLLIALHVLAIGGLFLYSYTQVDLNLTLSRITFWFAVQDYFQHIGYFERPLSTFFYIAIIATLLVTYLGLWYAARRGQLTERTVWKMSIVTAILLTFSYPAFSYDLFNYMFDVRIVTKYSENPYLHKALDYPLDPWIQFMRWTHRTYPYGPVWLGLTIPLSYIGEQFFLPTMYLFKALMAVSFLGTLYYLKKILTLVQKKERILESLVLFALSPLVIVESLVSSHNDIVMFFFAVAALYFLIRKRFFPSFVLLALSIGIKFATIFLLPIFILVTVLQYSHKTVPWQKMTAGMYILMLTGLVAVIIRTQFQPWYLLYILPFIPMIAPKKSITIPAIVGSVAGLLLYIPFLYFGNWDGPVPAIMLWISIIPAYVSLGFLTISLVFHLMKRSM